MFLRSVRKKSGAETSSEKFFSLSRAPLSCVFATLVGLFFAQFFMFILFFGSILTFLYLIFFSSLFSIRLFFGWNLSSQLSHTHCFFFPLVQTSENHEFFFPPLVIFVLHFFTHFSTKQKENAHIHKRRASMHVIQFDKSLPMPRKAKIIIINCARVFIFSKFIIFGLSTYYTTVRPLRVCV